jgi:hypothetical protein
LARSSAWVTFIQIDGFRITIFFLGKSLHISFLFSLLLNQLGTTGGQTAVPVVPPSLLSGVGPPCRSSILFILVPFYVSR